MVKSKLYRMAASLMLVTAATFFTVAAQACTWQFICPPFCPVPGVFACCHFECI